MENKKYYILKQFYPGTNIYVVRLDENDTVYSYDTLEEAEAALPTIQSLYEGKDLKIEWR